MEKKTEPIARTEMISIGPIQANKRVTKWAAMCSLHGPLEKTGDFGKGQSRGGTRKVMLRAATIHAGKHHASFGNVQLREVRPR